MHATTNNITTTITTTTDPLPFLPGFIPLSFSSCGIMKEITSSILLSRLCTVFLLREILHFLLS